MARTQPDGYLALPFTGNGPGVLVLHAWWGLNDTMKAFCTRLAEAGFVTFAPDLYHGKVADTIPDAQALGQALDTNYLQAKAEIADATMFLNEQVGQTGRGLAVIGFSLGAYYALDLAAALPEHIHSIVLFYGTGGDDFSSSSAAYLGHFAEEDEFEPQANVDKLEESLRRAGRPVTFYRYSGAGHWFFEPDRAEAYNQAAASLAWDRTLAFLKHSSGILDLAAILISQYQASLEMLKQTIIACPESIWNAASDKNKFWQVAYHALYFTHEYLADSYESFTPWIKHREVYDFDESQVFEPYDKDTILEYLAFCQQHVAERVPRLKLDEPEGHGRSLITLELHLYSIRHLMQHTGELMERLGARTGAEIAWVGWKHG